MQPFISICIPSFNNKEFLERLLHSISLQTFKDFEVILTDDSQNNQIEILCNKFSVKLNIQYYKNKIALGSPANWNAGIKKATGQWIKIMHHDDWFAHESCLQKFADVAKQNSTAAIIFSGFTEVNESGRSDYIISRYEEKLLTTSPLNLFKKNFIGHPSTTLIKNNRENWYDETIKWVVDFEFYMRCLSETGFCVIKESLVCVGIHDNQITKIAFRNPAIELPENIYLLNIIGVGALENIFVYDYYWRLLRNLGVRNINDVRTHLAHKDIPTEIEKMIIVQRRFSLPLLRVGFFSKIIMFISRLYVLN